MNFGERYDAWLAGFVTKTIEVHGIQTAVYSAPIDQEKRPTVLFVHGINGDFHGLVPLAYELRDACRALLVDLPGHGATELPKSDDIYEEINAWAHDLITALTNAGLEPALVVGHSFGAHIAQQTGFDSLALLNPTFGVSALSRYGTTVLDKTAGLVGPAYSSYPAMVRRGHWLMHRRTEETDGIIAWSSGFMHVTPEQFRFQSHLGAVLVTKQLVDLPALAKKKKLLVLVSQYDRIVDNSKAPLDALPNARIVTLPTDHVSVFEMPARVAAEVRKLL